MQFAPPTLNPPSQSQTSQSRGNSLSSTDQSQCFVSTSSLLTNIQVFSPDCCVIPYRHSSYYDSPANQSGSSVLPIQVSLRSQATYSSVMGRRNATRSKKYYPVILN
ncbi:hypothetical protein TNCV_4201071 [Trichonephila clavipes]|uniref:Uncharacterized protein n=1 Tax=Trichonephila clavipes TaxID=2585209 RepID=A0A8X6WBF3_TRICX|nr:hypothetical protein TNCV_4201071 [Trichonephila clavipes]